MKDPAFLFYPNDYLGGTLGMTFEEKGAYIELLMLQFNRGHMTNHMIAQTLGQTVDKIWPIIESKFIQDDAGNYFNERLELEKNKRKSFTESRRNNIKGVNQHTKKEQKKEVNEVEKTGHMTNHMENENRNENKDIINNNEFSEIKNILTDEIWKESFCLNTHIDSETFDNFMSDFLIQIELSEEYKEKNISDIRTHFLNIVKKRKNGKENKSINTSSDEMRNGVVEYVTRAVVNSNKG